MKVGLSLEDDLRRAQIMREEIGPACTLMFDANQVWEVHEAIAVTGVVGVMRGWIETTSG